MKLPAEPRVGEVRLVPAPAVAGLLRVAAVACPAGSHIPCIIPDAELLGLPAVAATAACVENSPAAMERLGEEGRVARSPAPAADVEGPSAEGAAPWLGQPTARLPA
jgi:hypothetical protein